MGLDLQPLVDSHLDLAENVTLFGHDLTASVAERRTREKRTSRQAMVSLPELEWTMPHRESERTPHPNVYPSAVRSSVRCRRSYSAPTNIDSATAETLSLIASSMDAVIPSLESSLKMLAPPETRSTIGAPMSVLTEERSTPRVSMSASA